MVNYFRNILLNLAPAVANADTNTAGYIFVDPSYVQKTVTDVAAIINDMLFIGCDTNNKKIARATTIFKIVDSSMLGDIIVEHDSRVSGQYALTEKELDVVPLIINEMSKTKIGSTDLIFIGRDTYTDHAFYRHEPLERIAGFACVLVDYVSTTRKL